MPLVQEIIDELGDYEYISLVDLQHSYMQFNLREEDRVKTAFTHNGKRWMFCVAIWGVKGMSAHMQRHMENLLKPIGAQPFINDIPVPTKRGESHSEAVLKVLKALTYKAGL